MAAYMKLLLASAIYCICIQICTAFKKDVFSTKTAYSWIVDVEKPVKENEYFSTDYHDRRCFAVNVQAVVRHGARFPGHKDISRMTEFHHKLKMLVQKPEFRFLRKWENSFSEEDDKQLVGEGDEEQYRLGHTYGKRFKDLFRGDIANVNFYSSSKDRSVDSAYAFYEGFTEEILNEAFDNLTLETRDNLLRFHASCDKFVQSVENNKTYMQYQKRFKIGDEMRMVANNVKNRLGLEHLNIDAGELKLIYFYCTYEMIILDKDDWCKMLTDEEREILEYQNDLKQYWKKGFGHPVIGSMACPLVQAIFNKLDKAAEANLESQFPSGETAAFYFGHAETVGPLYTALGLFNDTQPLKHDNFKEMKNRLFKSSQILPFSANFAIVLYKCDHPERAASSLEDYVVRFYVNEQEVKIPACEREVCKLSEVKLEYYHHIDGCDYNKVCSMTAHDEL